MRTGLPGRATAASPVSSSATISMRVVSARSSSGVPIPTTPSLAWCTRSTMPATGARTLKVRPEDAAPDDNSSATRVCCSSKRATRSLSTAPSRSRVAASRARRSVSALAGDTKP